MCEITLRLLSGLSPDSNSIPAAYQLALWVRDCDAVSIVVRHISDNRVVASKTNLLVTGQPNADGQRSAIWEFVTATRDRVGCDGRYRVTVTCYDNANCRAEAEVVVDCKAPSVCPDHATLDIQPAINPLADCIAAGTYQLTVIYPSDSTAAIYWSYTNVDGSGYGPLGSGPTISYSVAAGDPPRIITAIVIVGSCPPVQGSLLIPTGEAIVCPAEATIIVYKDTQPIAAPYVDLAPGDYEVLVAAPIGSDITYTFSIGNGLPDQTGTGTAANRFSFPLAEGENCSLVVAIQPGECCPLLTYVLTFAARGETTGDTPPASGTETAPSSDSSGRISLCGALRAIAAIALAIAIVALLVMLCPGPFAGPAASVLLWAAGIAAAAIIAAFLICGLDLCGLLRIICWALKWAVVIVAIIALVTLNLCIALWGIAAGFACALLIHWMRRHGCREPSMISLP